MQPMPILTLCRAQYVGAGLEPIQTPHFFIDELLTGVWLLTHCPHPQKFPHSDSDLSCYMQNCTFSFRMQLRRRHEG